MENNHDKLINKIFWKDDNLMNAHKRKTKLSSHTNINNYIENRYNDSESVKETLYRIHYNIEERPKCKYCGKPTIFVGRKNCIYQDYCSNSCAGKGTDRGKKWFENQKKYNKEKYGVTCNFFIPTINKKKTIEKIRETCLERYGVSSNLGIKEIKRGNYFANPNFKEKAKQTSLKKYGVDNFAKTKEFKELIRLKKEEIQEKSKKTCLERYGVDNYIKTKEFKERVIESKRKNHAFNTSKLEENLYLYINEKFPSVIRQYKDKERYPYCCDFYIPELDYFIELNGNWTHGKHPYNIDSIEDKKILEFWNTKSLEGHKYYLNAIKTWTIYDVNKRNKDKENNLNFKEVWSLEEGKEFIDGIYEKRGIQ